MRQRFLYPLLALVMFTSGAQAQIGDWQDVQDLRTGATIIVQVKRQSPPTKCVFDHATRSALFCERASRSPLIDPREIRFNRSEIRRVSFEYYREGNAAKGALIGMGVGATIGAVSGENVDARSRLASGTVVGAIGAMVGSLFARGIRTVHLQVVYQWEDSDEVNAIQGQEGTNSSDSVTPLSSQPSRPSPR